MFRECLDGFVSYVCSHYFSPHTLSSMLVYYICIYKFIYICTIKIYLNICNCACIYICKNALELYVCTNVIQFVITILKLFFHFAHVIVYVNTHVKIIHDKTIFQHFVLSITYFMIYSIYIDYGPFLLSYASKIIYIVILIGICCPNMVLPICIILFDRNILSTEIDQL